jgi:tetratricopeptide (TPR) repeat protein
LTARFELQDKVASSVAGVIEPALQAAETARSANRPTNDLTAYDFYLRAHAMLLSSARQIPQALRLLEQAMVLDPRYGPALAYAAICCFRLVVDGRSEDPEGDRLKGMDFARRALEVASDDPGVLVNAAHALAYFGEDIGAMIALVDRALALNPNFARGWSTNGVLRYWAGQPEIAIGHLEARAAAQSARANQHAARCNRLRSSPGPALWGGPSATAPCDTRRSKPSDALSISRCVLCPYGQARRRPRDTRAAAHHHPSRDPGRQLLAEPGAP